MKIKIFCVKYWKNCDLIAITLRAKNIYNAYKRFKKEYGFYQIESIEVLYD